MSAVDPIFVHRYTMRLRGRPNAATANREVSGALIRRGGGFGCLQPWPTLGDPPLDELLREMADGGGRRSASHPLVARAIRCAEIDGDARARGESVIRSGAVPRSHLTWLGPLDPAAIERAAADRFRVVKIKAGSDLAAAGRALHAIAAAAPAMAVRIDFNAAADLADIASWLAALPDDLRARIDFLEDPAPFDATAWAALQGSSSVRLARDRGVAAGGAGFAAAVIKPAAVDPVACAARLGHSVELVCTTAMDHPLGQMFAAAEAARLADAFPVSISRAHGLLTHSLFEPNPFTEAILTRGPLLVPPPGTGLGFDDLLETLPWKKL